MSSAHTITVELSEYAADCMLRLYFGEVNDPSLFDGAEKAAQAIGAALAKAGWEDYQETSRAAS